MPLKKNMDATSKIPIISFTSATQWRGWLAENHTKSVGVWIRIFKKDSAKTTVTHGEALDEALCYGWIDGQTQTYDEQSWLQKFTPRRSRSIWSKRNKEHVARLIKRKRMMPSGLKEVEAAKQDGRWDRAYDSPSNATIPADFLKEVSKDKKAKAFFDSLNKANRYSIAWRLQTAKKPETRQKRMLAILAMMAQGNKFHE
jgi:uncharacterized protein YdeI (YjbR/CyaY-like superfamily)